MTLSPPSPANPSAWPSRLVAGLAFIGFCMLAAWSANAAPASSATVSRSVDVKASPASVWSVIGPFCAIKDWHPAIGSCTEDGMDPPTRTLITKDSKVTFIEPQTARSDTDRFYSYTFKSSPFPVTRYVGTIRVLPKGETGSTILWSGVYAPLPGKEQEAEGDFAAVYEAGLAALKARFGG